MQDPIQGARSSNRKTKEMLALPIKVSRLTLCTALIGVFSTPIGVWAGIALDNGNYYFGAILIAVLMCIDGASVVFWINAQKEELKVEA